MRWRLVAVLVGVTFMVLAVHDLPLARHLEQVERDRLVTALERDAFTLAGRMERVLEAGDAESHPEVQDIVDRYAQRTGAMVVVTDVVGTAVLGSMTDVVGEDYSNRAEILDALDGRPSSGRRESQTLGEPLVYVAVPVLAGESVYGSVRLTYPEQVIDDRVAGRVRRLLIVAAISLVTATIAALLLAGTVTRPLRRLRNATEALASGSLDARAPADDGPAEVRALARAFNTMATRLQGVLARQRAFAGDASHQLRTPLTALRLRLEQANDLLERDPATARERLEAARAETERLQHLVEGLLALARAEGVEQRAELTTVDVAAIAAERVTMWAPLAEEQGVELQLQVPSVALAIAVGGGVDQIIDSYLDNALEVAPPGSSLVVWVDNEGDAIALHVIDGGPGMTDEQRDRAFDRFWRGPGGGREQGVGLGLAIVHQLATVSGATVELRRAPSGGVDAIARFRPARATVAREPSSR